MLEVEEKEEEEEEMRNDEKWRGNKQTNKQTHIFVFRSSLE